jgi:hypothetical protein
MISPSTHLWFLSPETPNSNKPFTMRMKYTSDAPDGTSITHYTCGGTGAPTSKTYQDSEQHLFAFPALLVGQNLLKVAETRSNKNISDEVAAAQKGPVTATSYLSGAAVGGRIRTALKVRAAEAGITLQDAQEALAAIRQANGIRVLKTGLKRTGKKAKAAVAAEGTSVQGDASDSEPSELETDNEQ